MFHLTSICHFYRLRRWRYRRSKIYGLMVGNVHICNENRNITLLKLRINVYNCFRSHESLGSVICSQVVQICTTEIWIIICLVCFINKTKHIYEYFVLRSTLIGVYRIGLTNELRMLFTQKNTQFVATLTVFFLTFFLFLFKCLGASLLCPFRWGLAFTRHFCGNAL